MELVNIGGLDIYLLNQQNKITMGERARMSQDASLAVEFIHWKNIIHRF